jgi:hypothetical protein
VRDDAYARWPGYVVGLGVVIAATLPAFRSARLDSFPLSTYPMFARKIDKPQLSFVERLDDKRRARRLEPELVAGDEVMQSYRTIKRAVRQGPEAAEELCRSIARRVSKREHGKKDVRLRIVRARFDPVAYFVSDAEPDEREVIASCTLPRSK